MKRVRKSLMAIVLAGVVCLALFLGHLRIGSSVDDKGKDRGWETKWHGKTPMISDMADGSIGVGLVKEENGVVEIDIYDTYYAGYECRIIAISKWWGKTYTGKLTSEIKPDKGARFNKAKFEDISLKKIKEFRFQIRPQTQLATQPRVKSDGPKAIDPAKYLAERVATELPPQLRAERDRLLTEADAKIRQGLIDLAKKFPQLKKAEDWNDIQRQSEASRIDIWMRHTHLGKGRSTRKHIPEHDRYSVLVLIRQPLPQPEQTAMSMFRLYPNLGLVGQVGVRAGDPRLEAALKKLIEESLSSLKKLEDRQEKVRLHYKGRDAPIVVELVLVNGDGKYHIDQSIIVEAHLKNTSNAEQVYERGFGMTSMKWECQIELITPDGKAWAAEAVPSRQFVNYNDIVLEAGQTLTIGRWDISKLQYNPGHIFRTMGDRGRTPFSSFAKPGEYSVRWWDGCVQGRKPLVSPRLMFEFASSADVPSQELKTEQPATQPPE